MNTYIISKNPGFYGNRQEDYVERVEKAITYTTNQLETAINKKEDLKQLFFHLVNNLGELRNNIAKEHNTNDWDLFGVRRDGNNIKTIVSNTLLEKQYEEYNNRLLTLFREQMKKIKMNSNSFEEKQLKIEETYLGRKSVFEFKILDENDLISFNWMKPVCYSEIEKYNSSKFTEEELKIFYNNLKEKTSKYNLYRNLPENYIKNLSLNSIDEDTEACSDTIKKLYFLSKKNLLKDLKKSNPELYEREKMSYYISFLNDKCPPRENSKENEKIKSLYVLGTSSLDFNGKLTILTQYLTRIDHETKEDPLECMAQHSKIMLLHQDNFSLKNSLKDISKIFEKAVLWDKTKDTLAKLKEGMAEIRYLLTCMPYYRGSAAISEWIEAAVYRFHGFNNFRHNKSRLIDLEAYASLQFSTFMKNYDSMVYFDK